MGCGPPFYIDPLAWEAFLAQREEPIYPAPLPKTGQTTIYAAGDDGDLQKGVAWPTPRFRDNADGTITDSLTSLIWDQNGNRFGTRTWAQALTDCNSLSLGGHTDWRLPNRKELRNLLDYEQSNGVTWLNGQGFIGVVGGDYYWSSTTYAAGTRAAWSIGLDFVGDVPTAKVGSRYVLAVRAGVDARTLI